MLIRLHAYAVLLLVQFITPLWAGEAKPPAADEIRRSISAGLAIVQKASENYPQHRQCFSCHHQTLPLLAMAEARDKGYDVDADVFKSASEFSHRSFKGRIDKLQEGTGIGGRANTVSYGLWALDVAQWKADDVTSAMIQFLLKNQRKDGRWVPPSNRPPLEESQVAVTVLSAYALQIYADEEQQADAKEAVARAKKWLASAKLNSQEDHVYRLWGAQLLRDGDEQQQKSVREEMQSAVLSRQNKDGGWSQLPDMESDAYATGQTLYVLRQIALPADHEAMQRGGRFLLSTQQDDGSWLVETRSRPVQVFFDNGDPHGKSQFISVAATSWAIAALANLQLK